MIFLMATEYRHNSNAIPIYLIIAAMFNPIIPVYFSREIWFYIDLLSGAILLLTTFIIKPKL